MGRERNQGNNKHVHCHLFVLAIRFALLGFVVPLRRSRTLGNGRQVYYKCINNFYFITSFVNILLGGVYGTAG